jgi:polyhydroxyalkanoate synthesis repressor PhaR
MTLIKRYPNRKLYDTSARQYVSLEAVAALIRGGETVQVIEHGSGEDITALILTQIISEQERRGGFLPLDVLTGLVQAGGTTLAALRRGLSDPLDLLRQVDEEIEARVDRLVAAGELAAEEGGRLAQKLVGLGRVSRSEPARAEEALARALARHRLPTRDDVDRLSALLDELAGHVVSLQASRQVRLPGPEAGDPPGSGSGC